MCRSISDVFWKQLRKKNTSCPKSTTSPWCNILQLCVQETANMLADKHRVEQRFPQAVTWNTVYYSPQNTHTHTPGEPKRNWTPSVQARSEIPVWMTDTWLDVMPGGWRGVPALNPFPQRSRALCNLRGESSPTYFVDILRTLALRRPLTWSDIILQIQN